MTEIYVVYTRQHIEDISLKINNCNWKLIQSTNTHDVDGEQHLLKLETLPSSPRHKRVSIFPIVITYLLNSSFLPPPHFFPFHHHFISQLTTSFFAEVKFIHLWEWVDGEREMEDDKICSTTTTGSAQEKQKEEKWKMFLQSLSSGSCLLRVYTLNEKLILASQWCRWKSQYSRLDEAADFQFSIPEVKTRSTPATTFATIKWLSIFTVAFSLARERENEFENYSTFQFHSDKVENSQHFSFLILSSSPGSIVVVLDDVPLLLPLSFTSSAIIQVARITIRTTRRHILFDKLLSFILQFFFFLCEWMHSQLMMIFLYRIIQNSTGKFSVFFFLELSTRFYYDFAFVLTIWIKDKVTVFVERWSASEARRIFRYSARC